MRAPLLSGPSLLLLWGLAAAACKKEAPVSPPAADAAAAAPVAAAVDVDDPQACAACHAAIVNEWSSSQHAVAHDEPIFTALLGLRKTREGEDLATKCARCHMPRLATRGVTCAACHGPGAAPGAAGALLAGPHDVAAGMTTAHATGPASAEIVDGVTVCMRCHEKLENPAKVVTCSTGVEWKGVAGAASCASCHMPEAQGPGSQGVARATHRSHRFVGPHARHAEGDAAHALPPVKVSVAFEGKTAVVALENLAPHAYPTGFPARTVVVEIVGLDAAGAEVWRNFQKDPMAEAPDAVLNRVFVDDQGQPTLAPWSVAMKRDTSLPAGETRTLRAEVPASVRSVRVRVLARLLAPTLAEKVGLAADPLAQPRAVATATASR